MRALVVLFALPALAADQVILIGIDGLAPFGIQAARTPRLDDLRRRGAYTWHARGVMPTSSSSNWASMIMGAGPEQHGVTSNDWQPGKFEFPPACRGTEAIFPTVYGELRRQRPAAKIGIFHHWDDYARLVEKSAPSVVERHPAEAATMEAAVRYWKTARPELLFVHLDHVDHAGHEVGWRTPEYRAAVEEADRLIGLMLDTVRDAGAWDRTLILVSADHGGVGKKHGGLSMEELEIPWIAAGANVRAGFEITEPVNTWDTAATIAWALGLQPHPCWIARPVRGAFRP